jgi:hypothetical protein
MSHEDSPSFEVLTLELQLVIILEELCCLGMAERSRLLSKEELDLVDFLVAQFASLCSSLVCEAFIAESSVPPPVACEVIDL